MQDAVGPEQEKSIVKINNGKRFNLPKSPAANQRCNKLSRSQEGENEVSHLRVLTFERFHLSEGSLLLGQMRKKSSSKLAIWKSTKAGSGA